MSILGGLPLSTAIDNFSSIPAEKRNVESKMDMCHSFVGYKLSRPHFGVGAFHGSTAGSKAPGEADTIVLVDLPEFLSPDEPLQVVKEVIHKHQVPTDNAVITLEKLRWNMGNLRKPNWLVKAPGISKLKGMVLTLQQEEGTKQIATARSKGNGKKPGLIGKHGQRKPTHHPHKTTMSCSTACSMCFTP